MRRNPRWLYAELNRSTHTHTHRHRHRLWQWQWQRHWQRQTGITFMHNAKPQNTRTAGATQRQSASSASAQFTLPLAHFSQLLAHNECLRGGKMKKKGGTGNVHVHKKEDKRRNNANDRRRNSYSYSRNRNSRSRSRNATLAVRDACTLDTDTAVAGAWRSVVESNTCKHTYTVKLIHAIQITTIAAQLQQQQQPWRHLASLISNFNCYR